MIVNVGHSQSQTGAANRSSRELERCEQQDVSLAVPAKEGGCLG